MSDLVRCYREYYREQTPKAFDSLFACMLDYDFSSYHEDMRRVYIMHGETKCIGESCLLASAGSSTGFGSRYEFGPNFHRAKSAVEGFLRLGHCKTLNLAKSEGLSDPQMIDSGDPPQYDFQAIGNWRLSDHLGVLFSLVDELYRRHGPINISALPSLWLSLTCDPSFVAAAEDRRGQINALVNTDSTSCFRRLRCTTHDQMIDWCSGTNFYTCHEGVRHFLPTFVPLPELQGSNLLSAKKNSRPCADLLSVIHPYSGCSCGRPRLEIVPHHRNYPVVSEGGFLDPQMVVDALPDRTEGFQILQRSSGFSEAFYYSREGSGRPRSLEIVLNKCGLGEIRWDFSRYFLTGRKRPLLWRDGSPEFFTWSLR